MSLRDLHRHLRTADHQGIDILQGDGLVEERSVIPSPIGPLPAAEVKVTVFHRQIGAVGQMQGDREPGIGVIARLSADIIGIGRAKFQIHVDAQRGEKDLVNLKFCARNVNIF